MHQKEVLVIIGVLLIGLLFVVRSRTEDATVTGNSIKQCFDPCTDAVRIINNVLAPMGADTIIGVPIWGAVQTKYCPIYPCNDRCEYTYNIRLREGWPIEKVTVDKDCRYSYRES